MMGVIYAECRYAECHYAECHYAECHLSWVSFKLYHLCLVSFKLSVFRLSAMAPKIVI